MKASLKAIACLWLVMLLASAESKAQLKSDSYWVIEGNLRQPYYTIIHFYNGQNQKIGETRLEGKLLTLTKRSHIRFLNRKLREFNATDSLAIRQNHKPRKQRG